MTDVLVTRPKLPAILRRAGLCLLALVMLVTLGACAENAANEAPDVQTYAGEGEAEQTLRAQLANDTVKEITIQGTLYLSAPVEVTSDKTIKGDGKLKASGDWAEAEDGSILVVAPGVELTLAESLTVDGAGRSGGVYVSDGAVLRIADEAVVCNAAEKAANVRTAGTFLMEGGYLRGAKGHNLYVLSEATLAGGEISGSGEGYAGVYVEGSLEQSGGTIIGAYDNVYVADKASFVWSAGQNNNSVRDGIHVAKGGKLHTTSADARMNGAGAQGIYLAGSATIDDVVMYESKQNHIKIEADAELVMNEGTLDGSKGHGITNRGKLTMNSGYISGSGSCGIVNSGTVEVKAGTIYGNTNKGILVKNGGKLTVNGEDISITGNHIGIAVEENAYAEVSKAKVNSNLLNNFSSFGELYLYDLLSGGSGSNCIATNYGGHVVARNINIVSTNGNNGIYNVNGSLVELTDVVIENTKTNAIRSLDADLIGENVTIINCGNGISTDDYIFGGAGEVTINGLTVSGTKGSNITTGSYSGGTIRLTDAVLGASISNNLSVKGGHVILEDVDIEGNNPNATTSVHGILLDEGGKITATNVTISDVKVSALRNRGGIFIGNGVSMWNIPEVAVSTALGPTNKTVGSTIISGLYTSGVGANNVKMDADSYVSLSNSELCAVANNNVRVSKGTLVMQNVTVNGHTEYNDGAVHSIFLTGGSMEANNITVKNSEVAAIRNNGGTITGANIKVDGADKAVYASKGAVTLSGLTTANIATNNIYMDNAEGTLTIEKSTLCGTTNNNIRIFSGVVTLKDTDVTGHLDTATAEVHAVMLTGGELAVDNVTIHDSFRCGIRNKGGVVSGKNLTLKNIGASGISSTKEGEVLGVVNLDGLVTENVAGENITADAGSVTLTNAALGISGGNSVAIKGAELTLTDSKLLGTVAKADSNLHGIMVTAGSAKVSNVSIENCDASAIRGLGGSIDGTNISVSGGTNFTWTSAGTVTVNGLTVEKASAENVICDGGVLNITNATLGIGGSNSVTVRGGAVTMTDSQILGTPPGANHGVYITKGSFTGDGLDIQNVQSALRVNGQSVAVEVENSNLANLRDCGVNLSNGSVKLSNVTIDKPVNNGIYMAGGEVTAVDTAIIDTKQGLNISGGTVDGTNVTMDGITAVGIQAAKASEIEINGLSVNAPDKDGKQAVKTENNISLLEGKDAFTGTVTIADAVLGVANGNNVVVKGGTLNLNDADIKGTVRGGAHGIYVTTGEVYADGLKIQDADAALRINNAKAVLEVSNAALSNLRNYGVNFSGGTVELNNVTIDEVAAEKGCGINMSKGELTAGNVDVSGAYYGLNISGGTMNVAGSSVTGAYKALYSTGGTFKGSGLVMEQIDGYGVETKNDGTVEINGLSVNAPAQDGTQAVKAAVNLCISEGNNGFTGTAAITDAVLGVTTGNNVAVKGGVLNLKDAQILGTTGGGAHGIYATASGKVVGDELDIQDSASALRINNANASIEVTNSSLSNLRDKGVNQSAGSVEMENVEITNTTNEGIFLSAGTLSAENVAITGSVTNAGDMTLGGSITGAVSNTGSLTIGKTYVSGGIYSESIISYSGSESAHTAADPMLLTIPEASVKAGTVLVSFETNDIAAALADCFTVPEEYEEKVGTSVYHNGVLEVNENTLRLFKDPNTYVAVVNGTNQYKTLEEAVAYAATVSNATTPATVKLIDDAPVTATIAVPANANIIITDDGEAARTISRSSTGSWSPTARGVMFDVMAGATLTFQSTGTNDSPMLTVDGNKANLAPTNGNWAMVNNAGTLNIGAGVKFANNETTGAGSVIRLDANSNATITGGVFDGNVAGNASKTNGAGVINVATSNQVSISNAVFSNNTAVDNSGAIRVNAVGNVLIDDCTFLNNSSTNSYGGAIYAVGTSATAKTTVKITNSYFESNSAKDSGGAINAGNYSVVTIENTTFKTNSSNNSSGAVHGAGNGELVISGSTFTGNTAAANGGAVNLAKGSITGSTFKLNSANQGGAINISSSKANRVVLTNCTITENTATSTGGAMNAATNCYLTMDGCYLMGNDAKAGDPQGENIRLAGNAGDSKIIVRATNQKTELDLHMQAASYVTVEGSLMEGSHVTLNWPIYGSDNRVPTGTAVQFDSEAVAQANFGCFSLSDSLNEMYHLELSGATIVVREGKRVAQIGTTTYETLEAAIADAAAASTADTPVTIELINDVEVSATIKLPADANIIITDDGVARTIKRSVNFNTSRGVMFDLDQTTANCSLTFSSTSNSNDNPLLILDGNNQASHSGNWAIVVVRQNDTLTVNPGVKFTNNYSGGAGAVIRVENYADAKLVVNGGVFTNNHGINNAAGAINIQGSTLSEIRNAVFSDNAVGTLGGAIVVNGGAKAIIENCRFESNSAGTDGGAIHIASTTKGDAVINNCTFTENSANKGGAINLPTGAIVSVSNCTFTDNTSNVEGKDFRLGGATSKVYLSGKVVAYVHNQNASTVHVEGTLSEGSSVEVHWLVTDANRIPAVAVQFDSDTAAQTNLAYIKLSDALINAGYALAQNGATAVLYQPAAAASLMLDAPVETQPTEPAAEPTEAVTEPTAAATEPTEVVTEPTEATTEPTEAVTEPTEAVTEPTEAVTEPTKTVTEPTKTVTEPTEAVTEPTKTVTEPTKVAPEPTEAAEEPTEPVTEPTTQPTEVEEVQ